MTPIIIIVIINKPIKRATIYLCSRSFLVWSPLSMITLSKLRQTPLPPPLTRTKSHLVSTSTSRDRQHMQIIQNSCSQSHRQRAFPKIWSEKWKSRALVPIQINQLVQCNRTLRKRSRLSLTQVASPPTNLQSTKLTLLICSSKSLSTSKTWVKPTTLTKPISNWAAKMKNLTVMELKF